MIATLTILTHKTAYNCTYWQRAVPFAVLAPGGQSGNFWIHPCIAGRRAIQWAAYNTKEQGLYKRGAGHCTLFYLMVEITAEGSQNFGW
jgi:hypothetical protein